VILTPHSGSATRETIPRLLNRALENLRLFFAGRPVATPAPAEG
jgi:lactate dehydrogenase-like 2-hydroxyacid dehydrogenase